MTVYRYRAKSFEGKIKKGVIAAASKEDFLARLKSERLFCLSYTTEEKQIKKNDVKLNLKELLMFCRQLSSMLSSGMTVLRSLEIMAKRAADKKQRKVFLLLYEEVQKGKALSEAMKGQGDTFPPILINMVGYGEVSGSIDKAISRMAENYEKEVKLKNSIKGAMTYPFILLAVSLLVVIVLMTFVMPIVLKMFDRNELPWSTRLLSDLSDAIIHYWYIFLLAIATVIIGYKAALKNSGFRMGIDKLKLRLPIFGKLNRTVATGRFARTLASLYSAGVPLVDSMQIAIKVAGNLFMETVFREAVIMVKRGEELSAAIAQTGVFDAMFNSMLYVGEQSGNLDGMLIKTAEYFDEQSETALKRMVAFLQPIMIVLLAVIVGFVILSIITPIYSMYQI